MFGSGQFYSVSNRFALKCFILDKKSFFKLDSFFFTQNPSNLSETKKKKTKIKQNF